MGDRYYFDKVKKKKRRHRMFSNRWHGKRFWKKKSWKEKVGGDIEYAVGA